MCVVSYVGDYWKENYPQRPWKIKPDWVDLIPTPQNPIPENVTKEDIAELKRKLKNSKKLLKAAKLYDEKTGQPDCEMDDKVALIKSVAKELGIDLEDIFK